MPQNPIKNRIIEIVIRESDEDGSDEVIYKTEKLVVDGDPQNITTISGWTPEAESERDSILSKPLSPQFLDLRVRLKAAESDILFHQIHPDMLDPEMQYVISSWSNLIFDPHWLDALK